MMRGGIRVNRRNPPRPCGMRNADFERRGGQWVLFCRPRRLWLTVSDCNACGGRLADERLYATGEALEGQG